MGADVVMDFVEDAVVAVQCRQPAPQVGPLLSGVVSTPHVRFSAGQQAQPAAHLCRAHLSPSGL